MHKRLLGVYKDRGTFIYALHPAVKFVFTLSFVIVAGFSNSIAVLVLLAALWLLTGRAARLSTRETLAALRAFRFFLVFTFVIQLFLTHSGRWVIPNSETIYNAFFFTARMCIIIGFSSFFAIVTPQLDIVRLFYIIFAPLRLLRISPADVALSMLIALRFIPLLFSEGEKILDAQRLKGVLPERGAEGARKKIIKASASLIIPLFVRTFNYASQIAITLSYRRHDRQFLKMKHLKFKDCCVLIVMIAFAAGLIALGHVSP